MHQLKASINECLQHLKGSGKFAVVYSEEFVMPGLTVDGLGDIAFPLPEAQAKALIGEAHKAPFGKGTETVLDDKVRSAWEIDADQLRFNNPKWNKFLNKSLQNIKSGLGLEDYTVEAHLYKLLIYEEGDFFLQHKDSEKEDGMFGSLVVGLPSNYSGGQLVIHFEGEEVVADFSGNADKFRMNCVAFYADCNHEVKPLKSGHRICLVYNLVQKKASEKIELQSIKQYANQLAKIFSQHLIQKPYITLLGHQYTPANFSYEQLKLNDRYKADALIKAAENLGYYAKLCLVTSYKTGIPETEYGFGYDDAGGDAIMGEVHDETLEIEQWSESDIPALDAVCFEEEDLITSFALDEDEPLVKESTGYMGNYGPDLMHWYHYGAVIIWSPAQNAQLLEGQGAATQLEWIGYFNRMGVVSEEEKMAVNTILNTGLNKTKYSNDEANFDFVADWLIGQEDKTFLSNTNNERLQMLFENMGTDSWQKIWEWLPQDISLKIFEKLLEEPKQAVFEKLAAVIRAMASGKATLELAEMQCAALQTYGEEISVETPLHLKSRTLSDLFWIERQFSPGDSWISTMSNAITKNPDRKYIHKVLVPQLLAENSGCELHRHLHNFCKDYLQQRVDKKPRSPENWSRPFPIKTRYEQVWKMLKPFMESPVEQVFDLKRNMEVRSGVENAILNAKVDLKTSTIKKGTPHTLRIEKTQASYERNLKKWMEDVALLEKLN